MKGSHPEQLTGAHLYLDIAKSGYLFHAVGNVMWNTAYDSKMFVHETNMRICEYAKRIL